MLSSFTCLKPNPKLFKIGIRVEVFIVRLDLEILHKLKMFENRQLLQVVSYVGPRLSDKPRVSET